MSASDEQPSSPGTPPPGWYADPDGSGRMRWWDGTNWGPDAPAPTPYGAAVGGVSSDERNLAILTHVLGIFTWFIGPLVIYLVVKPDQRFAKHHAAESLNFQLTVLIAWIVVIVLSFLLIGLIFIPVVWIGALVFEFRAAIAANRGEWYRYPVNLRMVSGAVD